MMNSGPKSWLSRALTRVAAVGALAFDLLAAASSEAATPACTAEVAQTAASAGMRVGPINTLNPNLQAVPTRVLLVPANGSTLAYCLVTGSVVTNSGADKGATRAAAFTGQGTAASIARRFWNHSPAGALFGDRRFVRITVLGASGGVGRELVQQATKAGHHVVAVARSIGSEAVPNLTPVKGSILDPGVAERAVTGADPVAWCVGVKTLGPAFLRTVTVFSESTRRAVEAMKRAGVSRLAVSPGSVRARAEGTAGFYTTGSGCPLLLGPSTPTRIGKRRS